MWFVFMYVKQDQTFFFLQAQSKWRVEYSEARKGHGVEQGREVIIIDR